MPTATDGASIASFSVITCGDATISSINVSHGLAIGGTLRDGTVTVSSLVGISCNPPNTLNAVPEYMRCMSWVENDEALNFNTANGRGGFDFDLFGYGVTYGQGNHFSCDEFNDLTDRYAIANFESQNGMTLRAL